MYSKTGTISATIGEYINTQTDSDISSINRDSSNIVRVTGEKKRIFSIAFLITTPRNLQQGMQRIGNMLDRVKATIEN